MRRFVALVVTALLLAGCGQTGERATAPGHPDVTPEPPALKAPAIRLHLDSGPVDLEPWTACYGNGCYDGSPPEAPVDVGRTNAVEFSFAREGWTFEATFREADASCPHEITVPTTKVGPTRFRVEPAGSAGPWDVNVFGRGPGGDVITTFRWNTPVAGTFPSAARSSLSVLADHDGRLDSYGVELGISDLIRTPRRASAQVTVIAADGSRAQIDLGPRRRERCHAAGQIDWQKPASTGRPASTLPGTTFTYVVRLDLDGVTYVGRGTWPADTNADITPAVPLTWSPALPAYRG